MKKAIKKKESVLSIRMDEKTKEQLFEAAQKDGRSMSGAAFIAIRDYIEKMKEKKP